MAESIAVATRQCRCRLIPEQWQELKAALLRTGLVQREESVGQPFLRFHPTFAPVLWGRLTVSEQREVRLRHQQEYYGLVNALYNQDLQNPEAARIAVRKELANLLWAVNGALDDQSENTVDFVDSVNFFLDRLGLKRDRAFLTERLDRVVGIVGSKSWYLVRSSQGEQLFNDGQYQAAAELFAEILQELDSTLSFDRVRTLALRGRCLESQGQLLAAAECLGEALSLSGQLEQSNGAKRQLGAIYSLLGDVLTSLGEYSQAQQAYENTMKIDREMGNQQRSAITEGKLGTLAMVQCDLTTAARRYQSVLKTFQQLQDPENEAKTLHLLGIVYQEGEQWAAADRSLRESARINEQQGNMYLAAKNYGQLAILSQIINNLAVAEQWYRKALQSFHVVGDRIGESIQLHNLANLLARQPNRLPEAYQMATAVLAINETLDPVATTIWNTYNLLARIATAQNEPDKAKEYRQLARTTKTAFAGTQYELQQHAQFIELVVAAVGDETAREQLEPDLVQIVENGGGQLVAAIWRVLAGEREVEALWDDLDADDSMIIAAILRGV